MTKKEDLIAKLQTLLGSTGAGVSGDMVQYAIDSALDDLARYKPKIGYELVNLLPGKAEYAVPAETYNVLDAIFPDGIGGVHPQMHQGGNSDWHNEFAAIGDGELSTFHSHSLAVVLAQKWEQFTSRFEYDWEYDLDENRVIVLPAPQTASKMLLKVAYKRTLDEVPQKLVSPIEDLALSECLRMLATSAGGAITSVPIGIGNVQIDSDKLVERADVLRATAIRKLSPHSGSGSVIIG